MFYYTTPNPGGIPTFFSIPCSPGCQLECGVEEKGMWLQNMYSWGEERGNVESPSARAIRW